MAITYVSNSLIPKSNIPLDGRTVVTFSQMPTIQNPYVGMMVYVEDEKTTYTIKEGCIESDDFGEGQMIQNLDTIRTNITKIATSDNILDLMNGTTIIGRPGPGVEKRFCLGTEEEADFSNFARDDREPDGWTIVRPEVTEYRPYVWSIEANIIYDENEGGYVLNGVWSEPLRENGAQGERGDNFAILGTYASLDALRAAVTNPAKGEAYAVGIAAPYDIYIWDGTSWVNHGPIQGPKGDKGDPAWRSITKFVYKSTNGVADPMIAPATPIDGSYDFNTGEFVIPSGWQVIDSSLTKPIWMTSKTFAEDTSKASDWSTPIMISGVDGSAGEDGVGIEYAYKRVKTEADAPVRGPQSEIPEGGQVDGWYDNAQGVDDEYQCEYVVIRTGINFEWSAWSTPVLWAKYGVNGQDGDGVEYLYYVKNDEESPINPTPKGFEKIESYNTYEFLPSKMGSAYTNINDENVSDYSKWSDNPHGVDKNNRYEFVAVRKKINGAWKAYSTPTLWAKWSADGTPGEATSVAYIDNPMDSVLLDTNGNVGAGLPCVTNFRVYKGSTEVQVTDLKWEADSADVDSSMVSVVKGTNKYATLTINDLKNNSSSKVSFKLTATADGKEYIGTFLINKISASAPNVVVDMGNDNVNVPCDDAGDIEDGTFPIFNTIDAFEGVDPLTITAVRCNTDSVSGEWVPSENAFKINNITGFSGNSMTVSLTVSLDGKEDRNVSFRVIKVVPGAPGEAAVFYEIKPNIRYIKILGDETIADSCKTLTAKVIKHVGSEITEGNPSDFGMVLYYNVDSDSIDVSKTLPTSGLDLSNAVTGNLDLDRYISLTLRRTSDQKIIDGPERLYMIHDGTPGKNGKDGLPGEAGKGIKSTKVEYGISASATTEPSSWNTTTPTLEKGKYLWTRTTWTYTDDTTEVGYQKTYIPLDGAKGNDGEAGKDGVGIKSTKVEYAISTSSTTAPTTGWSTSTPTLTKGSYLWTRTTWTYTDDTTETSMPAATYIGTDGTNGINAVTYRLAATDTTIRKSNTGAVKNTETITVSIYKIDGDSSTAVNVDALPSAYEVRKTYYGSSSTTVTSSSDMSITTSQMASATQYIKYELYYTQTGTNDEILVHSVVLNVVQDGPAGASGRIMYPAGEWVSGKTYTADETSTPYVFDPSGKAAGQCYFYLAKDSNSANTTTSPYTDWTANKNSDNYTWKVIPNYEVILADVGLFNTANVGPAVFYGDYVFSQTSTTGGTNFKDFAVNADGTINTSKFNPAIWFNFKTGAGSLAKGNISWDSNGTVHFGSGVKLDWNTNIDNKPAIGDSVTAITAEDLGFAGSGQYIRVDSEVTYNGETGLYLWIHENDLSKYKNDEHLNSLIMAAFTYSAYDNIQIGDPCWAGSAYYSDDTQEWNPEVHEMDNTTVSSVVKKSNNLTAEDVTGIIKSTEISGNQIKTGTIDANLVNVTNINASNITAGKIGARLIDVDNITVSKLDTKPSQTDKTAKITVEGNDMIIYNRSSANPAIKISGDTLPNLSSTTPVSPGRQTYNFSGASAMTSSPSTTEYRKLGTITVDANCNLTLSLSAPSGDLALYWGDAPESAYHANVGFGLNFISDDQFDLFRSTMDFSFDIGQSYGEYGIALTGGDLVPVIDGNSGSTLLKGKTYDIYEVYFIEIEYNGGAESELQVNFGFRQYEESTTLVNSIDINYQYFTPTDRISELGNDGIRFRQSSYEYFETCGNEMIIQNYHSAMGFNGNGLWMAVAKGNGLDDVVIWSNPTISNGTLTFGASASTTYQNIRSTMFRH